MGKLDNVQTEFLRDTGHFADIWNGMAFDGKQVLSESELLEINPVGVAITPEGMMKKTADMVMARLRDGRILGILIAENQKEVDYGMIIRVHHREVMEYEKQLKELAKQNKSRRRKNTKKEETSGEYMYGIRKEDRLRPVATLILYWNSEEWDGATTLHDFVDFSGFEEVRNLVSDFKINMVNIGKIINEETIFQNHDVRNVIALFLRRNDKNRFKAYVEEHGNTMGSEASEMLSIMVESKELKGYLDRKKSESEEEKDMCRAITELIEDGRNEGLEIGRSEGIELDRNEMIAGMLEEKIPLETIVRISKYPKDKVLGIASSLNIEIS